MSVKYAVSARFKIKEDPFTNQLEVSDRDGTKRFVIDRISEKWMIWEGHHSGNFGEKGKPVLSKKTHKPIKFDDRNEATNHACGLFV